MRIVIEDDRQKVGKHTAKNLHMLGRGVHVFRARLPFGDYMAVDLDGDTRRGTVGAKLPIGEIRFTPSITVDTKSGIGEVAMGITSDHARFRDECEFARKQGVKLVILVETDEVRSLSELERWTEPEYAFKRRRGVRRHDGARLAKSMRTMNAEYGVLWAFCPPEDAGMRILELLGRGGEGVASHGA